MNDQENGVENQGQGKKNSSLHPTPCSGNIQNVQESGREETIRENHDQNNMHGAKNNGKHERK